MKNKIFSLFGFAILALLVLTSFASAAVTLSATTPTTLSQSSGSFTIGVTSSVIDTVSFSATTITNDGQTIVFTPAVTSHLFAAAETYTLTINYVVQTGFDFAMKAYTTIFTADGAVASNDATSTLTFAQTDFCAWDGNALTSTTTDLEVSIEEIKVINGFGEETEWYPEDEVQVEVLVENNNNDYDVENIVIEWGLFNKETGKWTIEVSDENDFNLKDGEEKTLTFTFKLDDMDEDFEDLTDADLVFYARATGEVDADAGEYKVCTSASEDVSLTIESEFVVLSNIILPETNPCGSQVQITAEAWNIGDEDQEDVYAIVYNKELGINQKVVLGDVDAFDNGKLDILVTIPQNAEEKTYTLDLTVYNEDSEVFQNDNDDYSKSNVLLKVEGGCSPFPLASVSANLQSEAKAGQEIIVKATIANTGSVRKTFGIEVTGFEEWATLVSLDKTTLDLNSKATGDVLVTLKVNNDAEGENTFNIAVKDGAKVLPQPVTVVLEQKPSLISQITGMVTSNGENNWYLWGIGALNLALVLVIIFVAIKVIKKKK